MCGIQVLVARSGVEIGDYDQQWARLTAANSRRGPDAHNELTIQLAQATIRFGAHVLHLRGHQTQVQPIVDQHSGDILCWNGEVFDGLDVGDQNDGLLLMAEIQRQNIEAFRRIEGPYAFVYLDRAQSRLWFSRDYLGRRSLLMKQNGALLISSVADSAEENWTELSAKKAFCMDLDSFTITEHEWQSIPKVNQVIDNSLVSNVECSSLDNFPEISRWQPMVDQFKYELMSAIETRINSIPYHGAHQARVGLLFSGGVDCITIAALLTQILPQSEQIELFNVAFENPRLTSQCSDAPDRKTGLQGWRELCQIDPLRPWKFVEVDVPYSDVVEYQNHIRQLLVPSNSVMDMSIAMALWFASRGQGRLIHSDHQSTPYVGKSRVLLLGMGADEQLGGYSRHRSAWDSGGWERLGSEIDLDVQRIATRNLGRDDRVVSDNGKEARFPFLAANVVKFLSQTPLYYKMDMRYPRGIGEKLLLRLLAYQLGLVQASTLAKRAIQFGARTAKMQSGKSRGQDIL
ncbi:hypothetical protein IWW36_003148 [Coemansia brasiliensis]|uniref:Glutamine amidotransferase type-2 domain-containing protein n=1 Tax=Coemansia brasiliensis TaxID=2650707 RepID=A0A9W8I5Z1_9FUNG|nr:hypothetical protein IWW36_003148 [Coemansia brasiliensis]